MKRLNYITDLLSLNLILSAFHIDISKKEDIEISGFLAATIAWGNRKMILRNANRMMELLDHSPYEFIMNSSNDEMEMIKSFVHRTFNSTDLIYFLKALQNIYRHKGGLEPIFKDSSDFRLTTTCYP